MLVAKRGGFALPTILIASSVMMIVLVVAMQIIMVATTSLQVSRMDLLAREASESGLVMARACLVKSDNVVTWTGKSLRPWTDCNGNIADAGWPCATNPSADSRCWLMRDSAEHLQTTFSVPTPTIATDGKTRILSSRGEVEQIQATTNTAWKRVAYEGKGRISPSNVVQISTSRDFACSLLDTKQIYCWGYNIHGATGPLGGINALEPSEVQASGALAGKTVSSISNGSFSGSHACAIAAGEAYCWGGNTYGQLGNGTGNGTFSMSAEPVKVANGSGEQLNAKTVTKIATGDAGTCAIADGRAYCWGSNTYGQLGNGNSGMAYSAKPVAVTGIPAGVTVTDISYAQNTACAVAGGRVYCWGSNTWLQIGDGSSTNRYSATVVGGLIASLTATAVQTGHATTCVIANGAVYCWGIGAEGALGHNSASNSAVPVKVVSGSGTALYNKTVAKLSSGYHFNCAVTTEGRAYCWGMNGQHGALVIGVHGGANSYVPVEVSGLAAIGSVTDIASSNEKTCVIINATTYCWGTLYEGQVRTGVTSPTAVSKAGILSGKAVKNVDTSGETACAITTDEIVACWGANTYATVGDATTTNRLVPTGTNPMFNVSRTNSSITVADNTACLVSATSIAAFWCWGANSVGKVGMGSISTSSNPIDVVSTGVLSGKVHQKIAASTGGVTCGIASGAVYCWGGYASAPIASLLGNNTLLQANGGYYSPVPVAVYQESGVLAGKTVTEISSGNPICVVASGAAYCWGQNEMGQLGTGVANAGSSKPVALLTESGILSGKTVTKVATGNNFGCVATTEPHVYCWGYNYDGQFGDGTRNSTLKPVRVTGGSNPLTGKTVTKLVAGKSHACALVSTGQMYCWGYNALGQLGDGTNTTRLTPVLVGGALAGKTVTDIAAKLSSTCAIADGNAYCWGNNDYGQIGIGSAQVSAQPSPGRSLMIPPALVY